MRHPLPRRQPRQLTPGQPLPRLRHHQRRPRRQQPSPASCTDASKLNDANCSTRTPPPPPPAPGPAPPPDSPARHGVTATPFGAPVDPDVKITYASPPPPAPPHRRHRRHPRDRAATPRSSSSITRTRPAGSPPRHLTACPPAAPPGCAASMPQPRRRVGRVQRQVRRPRQPHPHDRGHQLRAPLQAQPHHRLRARTRLPQNPASRPARTTSSP